MPYWARTGLSKPYSLRTASWRAGSSPRSPARVSIGSPGTRRIKMNASSVMPRNVGTTRLTRVRTKRIMGGEADSLAAKNPSLQIDSVERVTAEWAELEVHHFLAHRLELHRMSDGEPGRLLFEDDLGSFVQFGSLCLIICHFCLQNERIKILIAPFCDIAAARRRRGTAEQGIEKVVRISIVSGPSELGSLVLAGLKALPILTPLEALDLDRYPDLGQIRLHELGDAAGIGIVRPLHRHRPKISLQPFRIARLGEQLFGGVRIIGIVLYRVIVGPDRRWHGIDGGNAGGEIYRVDDRLLVDRHVEGPADVHVVERLLLRVVGEISDIETRLL